MNSKPESLQEAILYFSDPNRCIEYLAVRRWPDGIVICPICGSDSVSAFNKTRRTWKCSSHHPKREFSIKVGTMMEDSPIGLDKWLTATWLLTNCKNGISSYEIARALRVTQKSAWFMLHRIRLAMRSGSLMKVGGPGSTVEADETVIGGKLKFMHKSRRDRMGLGLGDGYQKNKTMVMGVLDRDARQVRATVIPYAGRAPMEAMVRSHVEPGTTMITDAHVGYDLLKNYFPHEVINHMEAYVRGKVHTNGI